MPRAKQPKKAKIRVPVPLDRQSVLIRAKDRKNQYEDVVRICVHLSEKYGSAANAAVQMIRTSAEFKQTKAILDAESRKRKAI